MVLIAAHRGTFGGSIIQNTILAFDNALRSGADIIEADVAKSADGVFFAFHTGQETLLGLPKSIESMTAYEISQINLLNNIGEKTDQRLNTLDEVLDAFKERCLINLDRSWYYGNEFIKYIRRKSLNDQILLKSPMIPSYSSILPSDVLYMPIIREPAEFDAILAYKLNLYGVELVFPREDSPVIGDNFIKMLDNLKLKKWVNAINIGSGNILSANHDDNASIFNPEAGWGWLISKGFDIIQTDWPMLLRRYLLETCHAGG